MRTFAYIALTAALALSGPGIDRAASIEPETATPAPLSLTATSESASGPDDICVQAREIDDHPGSCESRTITTTSVATKVDPEELSPSDAALVSADGTTLSEAAAAGVIYSRTWSQERRGLFYINWMEKHTGRFYFNGSQVWSTTKTLGFKGTHVCNQGFGILYDIIVTRCATDVLSTSKVQEWDYFRVHVVWRGIPVFFSYDQHVTLTKSGSVS